MRKFLFLVLIGIGISFTSCRKDFVFEPSQGNLGFSKDTVYLDTVFTNIGSSTYRLKVYNRSDKDISIPKIQLKKGVASKYRLTVDGRTGDSGAENKIFSNVELLAKDSLFIFIEVTADVASANPTDFLYTDKIDFYTANGQTQDVDLVTLVQDAYFIYPNRTQNPDNSYTYDELNLGIDGNGDPINIRGRFLRHDINDDEYTWNNTKPYVVYGYAAVPNGETLNVEAGARIHFHSDSGLIVGNNATLKINGSQSSTAQLENEVIFEGDRLEPGFSDTPGQWGTIWLTSGSINHVINHLTIKNAVVGLLIENNAGTPLIIKNTQIYNSSNIGIYAKTATIVGKNVVVNYGGQAALACTLGGSYEFKQCTFNNNWPSSRQVAVLINNYYKNATNQQVPFALKKAEFYNSIIFGSNQVELSLDKAVDATFWTTPIFSKCQIKFNNINNQFSNSPDYLFLNDTSNIIKNKNPNFFNIQENKLMIGNLSAGNGFGSDVGVPIDIIGNSRTPAIDLGAYQHIIFPN